MKTIRLDDRELDLARRCFDYLIGELERHPDDIGRLSTAARNWMRDEITALRQKFEP